MRGAAGFAHATRADDDPRLKLAIPRGALYEGALDLLDAIGIETAAPRGDSRALVFEAGELTLVTMRPSDVPTYVEAGAADLGITGKDVLDEQRDRAVYELLELGFGRCRMVLACRRGDRRPGESERRLGAMRIATKYPRTAERYFERSGRQVELIEVKGSVELAPLTGLAEGIVDLVDSGRTLAENDLEVREEIATLQRAPDRQPGRPQAPRGRDRCPDGAAAGGDPVTPRIERFEWDGADAAAIAARLRALTPRLEDVGDAVAAIVDRVREQGDAGVRAVSEQLGEPAPEALRVDPEAVAAAPGLLEPAVREGLRVAAVNVTAVARAELAALERAATAELEQGQRVEVVHAPVAAAGVYAPGGKAAYPSSVLMCCLPAKVAGVTRIAVASPPGAGGRPSPAVLAACALAEIDEVYAIGGAQAIAALALGTESVPAVDVVVGPGNRYVTEAKRRLAGRVGIEGLAGPSELLVVAGGTADPEWIALDLCAQAEHGEESLLVVVSHDGALLDRIGERVTELAAERPTVSAAALALVVAPGLELSLSLADAFAPEHLELAYTGADAAAARGRIAGCVFVGTGGATAFGDYAAGSNHVLPTTGAARFGGPLGPGAFMRRTSVVSVPSSAARELSPHVSAVADAEGFPVHGESARARAKR